MTSEIYGRRIINDLSDGAKSKYYCTDGFRYYYYKSNKLHSDGEMTYEGVSEYVSYLLGCQMCVQVCPVELTPEGCFSMVATDEMIYSFIELSEEFSHSFHLSNLQTFDISTLLNKSTNPYWKQVVQMLFFDILIGNSDRHPGNFAYYSRGFYPLYDNGSSLLCYIREDTIPDILRDCNRFNALMTTKSKPVLRVGGKITHLELLNVLKNGFPSEYESFGSKVNLVRLDALRVSAYSDLRWELVSRFLSERMRWFQ